MPTVFITGANRGIGLALAQAYAADDWTVHVGCRHPEKAGALKAIPGRVITHRLDVTDGLRVASLARELAQNGEGIDVLINNAGVYGGDEQSFGKVDYDDWVDTLKVNTLAPLRMAERFADLVANSEWKTIANISSKMGSVADNTSGGYYIYRSSKAALNMVTKSLAIDLKERGITVLTFHPGHVATDMGGRSAPVAPMDSAAGIKRIIAESTEESSGSFFDYQGARLPW